MITVSISINGQPIFARSATNQGKQPSGFTKYLLDDGTTVLHKPEDGAVPLAVKMLNKIKEQTAKTKPERLFGVCVECYKPEPACVCE